MDRRRRTAACAVLALIASSRGTTWGGEPTAVVEHEPVSVVDLPAAAAALGWEPLGPHDERSDRRFAFSEEHRQ